MADRIEENDIQEGTRMAWHDKTHVREFIALDDNNLTRWDVEPTPVYIHGDGDGITSPEYVQLEAAQLLATDNKQVIGLPYNPATYTPLTNARFLQLVRDAVKDIGYKVVSIGSVRNRGRTFVSLKVEGLDDVKAAGHTFETFLNFGNSFDKSSDLWFNTSNKDTVCDNTFSMNMTDTQGKIAGRRAHTSGMIEDLPAISKLITLAVKAQADFAKAYEGLAGTPTTQEIAERVFAGFLVDPEAKSLTTRSKGTVSRLLELFHIGKGSKGETRADMFNAATDYYTHEGSGKRAKLVSQFQSSEFGYGAERKREFLATLTNEDLFVKVYTRGAQLIADAEAEQNAGMTTS